MSQIRNDSEQRASHINYFIFFKDGEQKSRELQWSSDAAERARTCARQSRGLLSAGRSTWWRSCDDMILLREHFHDDSSYSDSSHVQW